ncbi:superoxide dismutase family protein [Sporosarcina sp. JAI121]|uniref:superoxide dismutase family protein n=1 Tax=Sporosarcina sp. JAI121 TaxID=2723064 RepID=UPI0017CA8237|nr:superoxide dismutase family protein [Sporosarcina sp. JAI121]NYF25856.1 Cu-Zn family superoxide dismutase [Sporosarcina sp. JAI121]
MKQKVVLSIMLSALVIAGGCGNSGVKVPVNGENAQSLTTPILNTEGNKIGVVNLSEGIDGVTINIQAEGLSPGKHGIHIHETAVCTPPDFKSAGSHFNPERKEHGFDNPKGFHIGDLPNLEVDADGKITAEVTTAFVTLKPGVANSLLDSDGSSLVIHDKADDYKTDPAGNSGDRIACASIGGKK